MVRDDSKTGVRISGEVIGGRRIGRELGFPTANIAAVPGVEVLDGVYAVRVSVDGKSYEGMANLGYRPSADPDHSQRLLEVNLFGFDGDIYGERLDVELVEFIRPEKKFDDLEALRRAIAEDRKKITHFFEKQ